MTNLARLLLAVALLLVQRVLDTLLPRTFSGDIHVTHKNAYFRVTIRAGGVHHTGTGWAWSWLTYQRDGFVSVGSISLGTPPVGAALAP
jgi:hypothetical protein